MKNPYSRVGQPWRYRCPNKIIKKEHRYSKGGFIGQGNDVIKRCNSVTIRWIGRRKEFHCGACGYRFKRPIDGNTGKLAIA